MIWLLTHPLRPPHASVSSTLATHRKFRKRDNLLTRGGEGCAKEAKSYDNEKPWSSINYSIFSYYNATNWHPLHSYCNCLAKVFKEFVWKYKVNKTTFSWTVPKCVSNFPSFLAVEGKIQIQREKLKTNLLIFWHKNPWKDGGGGGGGGGQNPGYKQIIHLTDSFLLHPQI
jgi:hypothetical protein